MTVDVRPYEHSQDYDRINRLLIEAHRPGPVFPLWLQPRWEYMHHHPFIVGQPLDRCGVAEDGVQVVGIVHFEDDPAFAYLQAHPDRDDAKAPLVDHAVARLGGDSQTFGPGVLGMWVNDFDVILQDIVADRGFVKVRGHAEAHSRIELVGSIPEPRLPDGFRLQSLADENDLEQVNAVLWRGFNHEGPPPDEEIPGRRLHQSAPNFRHDLTIVAVAPDGRYASFAGMWVVPENRIAYVEPVATDPEFRRMGLGGAAVLEALRRAAAEGAGVAWVGSDQAFYHSLGFRRMFRSDLWLLRR